MNIMVLNGGKGWGGIESHTVTLASSLAKRGHKVIIGCPAGGSVMENAKRAGLATREIKVVNSADAAAIMKIMKTSRREKIEIIIANLGKEYWPAAIAARLLGIRVIFFRHQVDRLKTATCRLIARHVDGVAAVSLVVRDALIASGVAEKKIQVIYNAIDPERFDPRRFDSAGVRRELGLGEKDIVVGTAGKLHEGKGVFELLHAAARLMKEHPSLKVLFVGEGPAGPGLRQETEKLSIKDRVVFAGLRNDMERMYSAMDIFVLPSTCREAFGMVIIEAMSMGKPVIATEVGGIPEIIRNGINGILVGPGDEAGLADAIAMLIGNTDLAARIAAEGRTTVSRHFSEEAIAGSFEKMIMEVTGR